MLREDHVLLDEHPHALLDGGGARRRVEAQYRALLVLTHSLQRDWIPCIEARIFPKSFQGLVSLH